MKNLVVAICLGLAFPAVPLVVYWLRHRPHRLTEGTQHIVLAGLLIQITLVGLAMALVWLV